MFDELLKTINSLAGEAFLQTPPTAFDSAAKTSNVMATMKAKGFSTAIRYYDHSVSQPKLSGKCLTIDETVALLHNGFSIVPVYETTANPVAFTAGSGLNAGKIAAQYAEQKIKQPLSSAIYFAMDFDATEHQLTTNVLPFMRAVAEGLRHGHSTGIPYSVGVYGSGRTCERVLSERLADFAWLANATGWAGYKAFRQSGKWHILQHHTVFTKSKQPFAFDPDHVVADCGSFNLRTN